MHTLLPFCDYTVAGLEAELPRDKKKVSKLQLLPPEPRMASVHLRHQPIIKVKNKKKRIIIQQIKKKKKREKKTGGKRTVLSCICISPERRFNSSCSEKHLAG